MYNTITMEILFTIEPRSMLVFYFPLCMTKVISISSNYKYPFQSLTFFCIVVNVHS